MVSGQRSAVSRGWIGLARRGAPKNGECAQAERVFEQVRQLARAVRHVVAPLLAQRHHRLRVRAQLEPEAEATTRSDQIRCVRPDETRRGNGLQSRLQTYSYTTHALHTVLCATQRNTHAHLFEEAERLVDVAHLTQLLARTLLAHSTQYGTVTLLYSTSNVMIGVHFII